MFIKFGSSTPSLPKFAEWRVKVSDCGWVPFEYAARVLGIYVKITVSAIVMVLEGMADRNRLFSDQGRSFSFDSRGTGYGRGEGCGIVILKPLDQALKDNDIIRSVIVASGINQDGKTYATAIYSQPVCPPS